MPKQRYNIVIHKKEHDKAQKLLPFEHPDTGETAESFSALISIALRSLPKKK